MRSPSIDRIAVVGTGTTGYGIGLVYAISGREVRLFDASEDALRQARTNVDTALQTSQMRDTSTKATFEIPLSDSPTTMHSTTPSQTPTS
jgi:3-hydroxyacyl-CoA dehydrogenase